MSFELKFYRVDHSTCTRNTAGIITNTLVRARKCRTTYMYYHHYYLPVNVNAQVKPEDQTEGIATIPILWEFHCKVKRSTAIAEIWDILANQKRNFPIYPKDLRRSQITPPSLSGTV